MLYRRNGETELDKELFKNPGSEYRSAPFWAWNSRLDTEELKRQIDCFSEMGFGGFFMHVRQGLETEYLGGEFLDAVKFCTEYAKSKNMLAWLYDEDRWPSGVAGGKVTANPEHRMKYLCMSVLDRENTAKTAKEAAKTGKPYFLAAFDVKIGTDGKMLSYKRVERNEVCENKRYFFLEQKQGGEPRYNYQSYVDTLSKPAIDEFIRITHEALKEKLGEDFGKVNPAIFTDEPQVHDFVALKSGFDKSDAMCAFTTDFPESYEKRFGESLIDFLPELFFETDSERAMETRFNYFSHLSERFNEAYTDNIGKWCEESGIMLTGHILGEDALYECALNNGDIIRAYRKMQLPGIDILCDDVVYETPIQCRSAVRQYGREAMLSEMYGVTGWDFDFRSHKYQGDWQACLGVSVRVPHLAWQSMKGEGKRDYPAPISYQSPWYREYKYLEDHYARINTALTRGVPCVNIAVLYPIDTYNIHFSSVAESLDVREALDAKNRELTKWLLSGAYDFDYLSESLLPELCKEGGAPLRVGKMKYDVVIVANAETLREHSYKLLREFAETGGELIIMGTAPTLSEGKKRIESFAFPGAKYITHSKAELYKLLQPYKQLDIRDSFGAPSRDVMAVMRKDGESKWLFAVNMYKPELPHLINEKKLTFTVNGTYKPYVYDTLSGEIKEAPYKSEGGKTSVYISLYDLDSVLLKFEPSEEGALLPIKESAEYTELSLPSRTEYELSEPNVLLLDMAEAYLNGEKLTVGKEEILRIDDLVRRKLSLQSRRTKFVQPWAIKGAPENDTVRLVFRIQSETEISGARLALENPEKTKILFNGAPVSAEAVGYYADKDIKTLSLPKILKGENILSAELPFGLRTDLEAFYIVGDFGVRVTGCEAILTEKPKTLCYGSVAEQGLAFYGGNISYKSSFVLEKRSDIELVISHYAGALVGVEIDGESIGRIVLPPFSLKLSGLEKGRHEIKYTLFGTRYNTFSALHNLNAKKKRVYKGPDFWRSKDEAWSYEYQLIPMGILKAPVLKVRTAE